MHMSLSELRVLMDREAWHAVFHGITKSRTWLNDWTELNLILSVRIQLFYIFDPIGPWCECVRVCPVAQSCLCPTLSDPMHCSLPDSSVHGILQTRILEWVAISYSRGSSQPRDWTWVSHIAGRFFTIWATREAQFWYTKLEKLSIELSIRKRNV